MINSVNRNNKKGISSLAEDAIESPRPLRRLHYLSAWSHEQDEQAFTESQGACREIRRGGAKGQSITVGGD